GSSSSTAGGLNTAGSSNKVNPSGTAGTSVTLSPSTTPSHGEDSSVLVEITDKGNNTFDDNTKITVAKASDTAEIDKNITACFGTEIRYIITNMSINATLNSPIMLTVTLPEGYNNNKTMAYMASQDGKLTTVNSSYTDGKLVFITDKLGTVVFVNTSPIHETETPSTTTPEITESELPESSASHTAGDENNDSESASAPTADTEENTTKTDNRSSDSNKGNKKNIKVILTVILIITIIVIGGIIFLLLFLKKKRKK
ncbi:MAG: hypothetical protein IJZ94_04775, partial [Clostridia bacterium]|nr:hypothetical protein [Clostridia bacterium]